MAEKKWCVYMHTNKINGKKYIGITSKEPIRRWGLRGQGYKTQYFKRAIDKYSWDNFEHEILYMDLTEEDAKRKEVELIKKYNTKNRNFGYNLTDGGDGTVGVIISEETRTNLRNSHIGQIAWNKGMKGKYKVGTSHAHLEKWKTKEYRERQTISHLGNKQSEETKKKISENCARTSSVYQLDLEGNIVRKWDRIKLAVDIGGFNSSSISNCCSNRLITTNGYIFIYAKDFSEHEVKRRVVLANSERNIDNKFLLKVYQYSLNGDFIKEYNSAREASENNNLDMVSIISCCNEKLLSCGKYIWSRTTDEIFIKSIVDKNKNKLHDGKSKIISKYNKNMDLLKTYKSCSDAEKNEDINKTTLKKYCINKLQYNGFYWRMEGIE